jgi:phosphoribosyl-ATP pyrophosphohydrolase
MAKKTAKPPAKKIAKAKLAPSKPRAKTKDPGNKTKNRPAAISSIAGPPPTNAPDARVLDRLWSTVLSRKDADPALSHSARLLARGTAKIAQKFGEEAVECLIEAVGGHRLALVAESADVLYHLLVLWVDAGLRPEQIWAELARREGISGITEKAARLPSPTGFATTKIP